MRAKHAIDCKDPQLRPQSSTWLVSVSSSSRPSFFAGTFTLGHRVLRYVAVWNQTYIKRAPWFAFYIGDPARMECKPVRSRPPFNLPRFWLLHVDCVFMRQSISEAV